MGYVTNFRAEEHGNHDAVIAETNRLFGTDLEIREHPRPDNTHPSTVGMHSLWSPHDWVIVSIDEPPFSYLPWWEWYVAHLHWTGDRSSFNDIWRGDRERFAREGKGFPHPSDEEPKELGWGEYYEDADDQD